MVRWQKPLGVIAIVLGAIVLAYLIVFGVNAWFERYHFVYHAPIEVRLFMPIRIEARDTGSGREAVPTATPAAKIRSKVNLVPVVQAATQELVDDEIAAYIREQDWDYDVAIRMAKSENFWNLTHSFDCSRTNTNKNGTTDYGLFQINSVHAKRVAKHGWTMEDMKDCVKNIVIAHEIWQEQGWMPWSAYTNKSYLTHDTNI